MVSTLHHGCFPYPKKKTSAPLEGSWTFLSVALWGCYTSALPSDNRKPPGWGHRRSRRKERVLAIPLQMPIQGRHRVPIHAVRNSSEWYIRTKNSTACRAQHNIHKNFFWAAIFTRRDDLECSAANSRQWRSVKLCRDPPSSPKHIKISTIIYIDSCSPRTAECGSIPDASFCQSEIYMSNVTSAIISTDLRYLSVLASTSHLDMWYALVILTYPLPRGGGTY